MATEADPVIVRIIANQRDLEKSLAASVRATERAATKMEKNLSGVGGKGGSNVVQFGQNAARATQQASQAAGQLSFQLNDIATSLSGGASPFQVMMQQGSQVAQVMQGIRAQGGSMGQVVAGAFTSMLNPISLVSFALIAVAGYALQYFTKTEQGGKEAEATLKAQRDLIDKVATAWGDALPRLKAYQDELKKQEKVADLQQQVANEQQQIRQEVANTAPAIEKVLNLFANFPSMKPIIAEWGWYRAKVEAGTASLEDTEAMAALLTKTLKDLPIKVGDELAIGFSKSVAQITTMLGLIKEANDELAKQLQIAKGLEGVDLSAALSGGKGVVPTSTQAGILGDIPSPVVDMIKREEGFLSKAKWDKTAFRVGFGSDTYVDEMGKVQKVTKDTVVTLQQADADLARRIPEFQQTIKDAIGVDTWRAMSEEQQAALTSIAYNYGSLPKSIVNAIQSGGGQQAVAQAIGSLSANPERRKREAAAFGGYNAPEKQKQAADDLYKSNEQAIEQQKRANAINADSTLTVNQKSAAIEQAKIEQDLLNAAQEDGITITDALRAKYHAQAVEMAGLGLAADNLADKQQEAAKAAEQSLRDAQRAAQEFQGAVQNALGGLIRDLIAGKDAGEALANALQKVADKALDIALNNLFSMGGPGAKGGMLGGMIIPGILHKGGVAGADGYGHGRAMPASVFAGARRYHGGGLVGGEVPAILKRGEIVIPKNMGRDAGGRGEEVNIRLHDDSGRMAAIADQRIQTASGAIVKVSVVQSAKTVQQQLPGMLANTQTRNG